MKANEKKKEKRKKETKMELKHFCYLSKAAS